MDNRLIFLYYLWHAMRRRDGEGQVIHLMDGGLNVIGRQPGKSGCQFQGVMTRAARPVKSLIPASKKSFDVMSRVPVPQTDTRRRGEEPKALERTHVKELCKLTP
jgi:hypothetical protein